MPDPRQALANLISQIRDNRTWADIATVDAVRYLASGNSVMLDCTLQPEGTKVSARFGTPYAGDGHGLVMRPRQGDEVLVVFPRGDLNRAVALGGIFNGVDTVPAAAATAALALDGRQGDDLNAHIRGNVTVTIDRDHGVTVTLNQSLEIAGTDTLVVGGDKSETIGGNAAMVVQGDKAQTVAGNRTVEIGENDLLTATGTVEIRSEVGVTIRAPFVKIIAAQTHLQVGDVALLLERLVKENFYHAVCTHTHPDHGWQSPQLKTYDDNIALTAAMKSE